MSYVKQNLRLLCLRHPHLMALTALFGEFIAHDFAHTPRMNLPNGDRLRCCDVEYEHFHPECLPIRAEDEASGCMEYARSAPHPGNAHQVRGSFERIRASSLILEAFSLHDQRQFFSKLLASLQRFTQILGIQLHVFYTK
jgi:peroxidase